MKKTLPFRAGALVLVGIFIFWMLVHIPGIYYGTYQVPLHQSYIGDEQSAVNGALHMLQTHSILGLRNIHTLYYGPVFAVIDLPAVVLDFASKWAHGLVHSAAGYENYILYDWGGIVWWLHAIAAVSCFLGLWAAYLLMKTRTMNPAGRVWLPYLAAALLGGNFYYFEYSNFSKHWAFIIPLAIVQMYCLVRIGETEGREHRYWIMHAIATILIFGISYGGVIFLVMWIPWLIGAFRRKDWPLIRRFAAYAAIIAVGWIAMVAWDPYPFFRNVSFVGVGQATRGNMFVSSGGLFAENSLGWYAVEIVLNDIALAMAGLLMIAALWHAKIRRSAPLWTLILPAIVGYLFFGLDVHHEGRYMLPTIVFLVLACGYLVSEYIARYPSIPSRQGGQGSKAGQAGQGKRLVRAALITLIACYAAFQIAADIEWMRVYAQGPFEETGITDAFSLQKTGEPVLMIQGYIAGAVHDKASYAAYIAKLGRDNVNLYQALMAGTPPAGVPELDVRYALPSEFAADPGMIRAYPHAVWEYEPIPGQINQFDYFDENVMRLWYYGELSPHWIVLK